MFAFARCARYFLYSPYCLFFATAAMPPKALLPSKKRGSNRLADQGAHIISRPLPNLTDVSDATNLLRALRLFYLPDGESIRVDILLAYAVIVGRCFGILESGP